MKQFVTFLSFLVLFSRPFATARVVETQFESIRGCSVNVKYGVQTWLSSPAVVSSLDCARACSEHRQCNSINVWPTDGASQTITCQLFAESSDSCDDLKAETDWTYYRKIPKNPSPQIDAQNEECRPCSDVMTLALKVTGTIPLGGDRASLKDAVLVGATVTIVVLDSAGGYRMFNPVLHLVGKDGDIHFMPRTRVMTQSDGSVYTENVVVSTNGQMNIVKQSPGVSGTGFSTSTLIEPPLISFYTMKDPCDIPSSGITPESLLEGVSNGHDFGVNLWDDEETQVFRTDIVVSDAKTERVSGVKHYGYSLNESNSSMFLQPLKRDMKMISTDGYVQTMRWQWNVTNLVSYDDTFKGGGDVLWTIDSCWEPVAEFDAVSFDYEETVKLINKLNEGRRVKVSYFDQTETKVTINPDMVGCFEGISCVGMNIRQAGSSHDPFRLVLLNGEIFNSLVETNLNNVRVVTLDYGNEEAFISNVTWFAETRQNTAVFDSFNSSFTDLLVKAIQQGAELRLLTKDDEVYQYHQVLEASISSSSTNPNIEIHTVHAPNIRPTGNCASDDFSLYSLVFRPAALSLEMSSWAHDLSMVCVHDSPYPFTSVLVFAVGDW